MAKSEELAKKLIIQAIDKHGNIYNMSDINKWNKLNWLQKLLANIFHSKNKLKEAKLNGVNIDNNEILIDKNPDVSFTVEICTSDNPLLGIKKEDFIVTVGGKVGEEISPGVFEFKFDK